MAPPPDAPRAALPAGGRRAARPEPGLLRPLVRTGHADTGGPRRGRPHGYRRPAAGARVGLRGRGGRGSVPGRSAVGVRGDRMGWRRPLGRRQLVRRHRTRRRRDDRVALPYGQPRQADHGGGDDAPRRDRRAGSRRTAVGRSAGPAGAHRAADGAPAGVAPGRHPPLLARAAVVDGLARELLAASLRQRRRGPVDVRRRSAALRARHRLPVLDVRHFAAGAGAGGRERRRLPFAAARFRVRPGRDDRHGGRRAGADGRPRGVLPGAGRPLHAGLADRLELQDRRRRARVDADRPRALRHRGARRPAAVGPGARRDDHAATAGRRFDEPGELRARLADRRVGTAAGPRPPGDALASRWRAAGRGRVPDGPAAARPRGRGDVQFRQRPGPRGSAGNRLCARAAGDRARRRDDADGPRPRTAGADSAIMAVPPPRSCR